MMSERILQKALALPQGESRSLCVAEAAKDAETLATLLPRATQSLGVSPAEARKLALFCEEIAVVQKDYQSAAQACRVQGQAQRAEGMHLEAIETLRRAAQRAEQAGNLLLAAQVSLGAIDSLGMLGRESEALDLADWLEKRCRSFGSPLDAAKCLVNAGNILFRLDRYSEALTAFEKALPDMAQAGDPIALGRVQANIANIFSQKNRIDEALAYFHEAKEAFESRGATPLTAMVDSNIAFLYYISGEHAVALQGFSRARQVFLESGMEPEAAKCEADMAEAFREVGLFSEALEGYERAQSIFQRLQFSYELARAERGRGLCLHAFGRNTEAIAALDAAEGLFLAQSNRVQAAAVRLSRLQWAATARDNENLGRDALMLANRLSRYGVPSLASEARFLAAEHLLQKGDATGVRQMRRVRHAARRYRLRWLLSRAERALALHFERQQDFRLALRHMQNAVKAVEEARSLVASEEIHAAFLRDKLAPYQDLVRLYLERGDRRDIAAALECVEKTRSRLLFERILTMVQQGTPLTGLEEEKIKLSRLRAELSRAYYRLHAEDAPNPQRRMGTAALGESLAKLEKTYFKEIQRIERISGESLLPGLSSVGAAKEIQQAIPVDETLIEYFVIDNAVCAFVVTALEVKAVRSLASVENVEYHARRLRYHLQRCEALSERNGAAPAGLAGVQEALARLHALLFAPLEGLLATEKLTIVPHSVLYGLPFAAFYDGANYLVNRYEILYAHSAALWRLSRQRVQETQQGERSALLMGVPVLGIENVAQEIEKLQCLLPNATALLGDSATLAAFLQEAQGKRWLHIATHALFRSENPLFSGLRFSDGWLFAHDLYAMRLSCDLATLSACRTGVSRIEAGEEHFGLARGFLMAGARSLATSFWAADDGATAFLMVEFYQRVMQNGSYASALRGAMLQTMQQRPHPYYWAAFALMGAR